jgi:tetratricopeptide (TPR) repeat protein
MHPVWTSLPLLLALALSNPFQDNIRQRYEAAEAARRAGNLEAAENEFKKILGEAYSKLGTAYSAQHKPAEAITALEAAMRYTGDREDLLVELSIACFNAEQYEKAAEPLNRALKINQNSAAAHHMLGKTLFMQGEFSRAAAELETAAKLAPRDHDVAYTLGLAYLKQRQLAPAKQIYDGMLKQLGDRPQLRIVFGRAYRETGFLPEAIEEFKRAVRLDPQFPRAHYYLGLTYLLKDGAARLSDAAEEFKIELAANPGEFFANYYLGIVYVIERKWELAIGLLEKASRIKPDNPDPYFHLGQAYQGVGRHKQAIEVLEKTIKLNPRLSHNDFQISTAHYRLGQSLVKVGRVEEGQKELQLSAELKSLAKSRDEARIETFLNAGDTRDAANKFPELSTAEGIIAEPVARDRKSQAELQSSEAYYSKVAASAHNNIGLLRAERQDYRAAAENFALAARWNPQLEGINLNWGLACYKAEQYKEAITPLEKEFASAPKNTSVRRLLGMSYFSVGDYAKASDLLAGVIELKPNDVGLYYSLALSLARQGKTEEAANIIKQMVATNGNDPQLHLLLGQAYYQQNAPEKALEELKAALALDSSARLAHYYSGLIHLRSGKLDDAVREFEAELVSNPGDIQTNYHLGFALISRQESARGIGILREVVRRKPDFADARYELGKALLQQGSIKEAVEHLEAAVKLGPDKSHYHYQLGRAYLAAGRKAEGETALETSRRLKEKERTTPNQ